jgi:undecaprenyl-diphosphatase
VGIGLIFTGAVLMLTYNLAGRRKLEQMNSTDAFSIGLMQGIAIIPGVSRSGSTISTGMILGIDKETAARFSFVLAVPAILGALVLHLGGIPRMTGALALPLAVGFVASFAVGYITLKSLVYIIRKEKFHRFALYCFAAGALVLVWAFYF